MSGGAALQAARAGPSGWATATAATGSLLVALTQTLAHQMGYPAQLGPVVGPLPVVIVAGLLTCLLLVPFLAAHRHRATLRVLSVPVALALGASFWGPLYSPLGGLSWLSVMIPRADTQPEVRLGLLAAALAAGGTVLFAKALARLGDPSRQVAETSHGSARLATREDLARAGLLSPGGFLLGGWPTWRGLERLCDSSESHALLFAPTRSGKTTGPLLSTLLTDLAPALVLDPKGEAFEHSAGWRHTQGHRCLRLSPTEPGSARWNPLAEIPQSPRTVGLVQVLAGNFIPPPPGESDPHWTASAASLFTLLVLHAVFSADADRPPTVAGVYDLLSTPNLGRLFETLLAYPHDPAGEHGFRDAAGTPSPTHPVVRQLAGIFASTPDRELGSIRSTLARQLEPWADPYLADQTSRSDFQLRDLFGEGAKPTTLYFAVPYKDLHRTAGLFRMLLVLAIEELSRRRPGPTAPRVHFLLDELASLGRVPLIESHLAFFAGYGLRSMLVVQDLTQVRRLYGRDQSVTANCGIQVTAATLSRSTREHASALAGEATVRYEKTSRSQKAWSLDRHHKSRSHQEVRRRLLTPDEVGSLPRDQLLVLKEGLPPILATKYPYFQDRELAARAALPPPPGREDWAEPAPPPGPAPLPPPQRRLDLVRTERDTGRGR